MPRTDNIVMFIRAWHVTMVSVLKDRKSSLFNVFIFVCQSSDDWLYVSQAHHHSNNEVEQLRAEIPELKEELAERERCLEATRRDLANLWYVEPLCTSYCIQRHVFFNLITA